MTPQHITLISFGSFEKDLLTKVANVVRQEFQVPVNTREGHIDLSEFYDPGRRQYDGNKLLKIMDSMADDTSLKIIGLFDVDLFIPILTYIYGQAFLNGRSGIVSLYRLRNERYGLKRDDKLLLDRLNKEVIHELGHTFGLKHCYLPECVMRSSTYVEDIDQKKISLCHQCNIELEKMRTDT